MSIRHLFGKIKETDLSAVALAEAEEIAFGKDGRVERYPIYRKLYLSLVILLVATLSFGLGRLSQEGKEGGIKFEYNPQLTTPSQQSASAISSVNPGHSNVINTAEVVASSKGTKYHYLNCPGAKQISLKNRLTFASAAAAEASGYTLASNCSPR